MANTNSINNDIHINQMDDVPTFLKKGVTMTSYVSNNNSSDLDRDGCEWDVPIFLAKQMDRGYMGTSNVVLDVHRGKLAVVAKTTINSRRWWHKRGRWILLVCIVALCLYADKKIEDKVYYRAYHEWYTDEMIDVEYQIVLDGLNWH